MLYVFLDWDKIRILKKNREYRSMLSLLIDKNSCQIYWKRLVTWRNESGQEASKEKLLKGILLDIRNLIAHISTITSLSWTAIIVNCIFCFLVGRWIYFDDIERTLCAYTRTRTNVLSCIRVVRYTGTKRI